MDEASSTDGEARVWNLGASHQTKVDIKPTMAGGANGEARHGGLVDLLIQMILSQPHKSLSILLLILYL